LSATRVETLVVTSGVIPIPPAWNALKHIRIAVSVDGLQPDHDERRTPATHERILENIDGRRVDISWVITRPQLERSGYLDEYLAFWSTRREIDRIWLSLYTPQVGEQSREMLTPPQGQALIQDLIRLSERYPALLMTPGIAEALAAPPANPDQCVFSRMSVNYSADLRTKVQPCFFGGEPDCRQCGCAVTAGLHWIGGKRLLGPIRLKHLMESSIAIGNLMPHVEPSRM
jgi:hypothetical protein